MPVQDITLIALPSDREGTSKPKKSVQSMMLYNSFSLQIVNFEVRLQFDCSSIAVRLKFKQQNRINKIDFFHLYRLDQLQFVCLPVAGNRVIT